jgi:hypothetical protein
MVDAMEVEESSNHVEEEADKHDADVIEDDDDEDVEDLLDWMDNAKVSNTVELLQNVMESPKIGPKAIQIKEKAIYELTRAYCGLKQYPAIVAFLENSSFFLKANKAKCAKVVRQVLI